MTLCISSSGHLWQGLCGGHVVLFQKHCEAPATVLAVKDPVLGHAAQAVFLDSERPRQLDP